MTSQPSLDTLRHRVRRAMGRDLPGFAVQKQLAPRSVDGTFARSPGGPPGTPAAALALMFAKQDIPHLILTVRSNRLPHHRGQISFPGGTQEQDESLEETALRETHEEIGVPPQRVHLAGQLTSVYIPPSGFRLFPMVGFADGDLELIPHTGEVFRILEVPVSHLLDPQTRGMETRHLRGQDFEVPYYRVDEHKVWGATAMILSELLGILGKETDLGTEDVPG